MCGPDAGNEVAVTGENEGVDSGEADDGFGRPGRGAGLSLGKRRVVGVISGVLAIILVLVLLNLATRHNASQSPEALPLAELQELTDERRTGLTGLIDIAEVVHSSSEGKVFDEDERIALWVEKGRAEKFLGPLDTPTDSSGTVGAGSESDEGLRSEVLAEFQALDEQTSALFDAVQEVNRAQTTWEEAQPK